MKTKKQASKAKIASREFLVDTLKTFFQGKYWGHVNLDENMAMRADRRRKAEDAYELVWENRDGSEGKFEGSFEACLERAEDVRSTRDAGLPFWTATPRKGHIKYVYVSGRVCKAIVKVPLTKKLTTIRVKFEDGSGCDFDWPDDELFDTKEVAEMFAAGRRDRAK